MKTTKWVSRGFTFTPSGRDGKLHIQIIDDKPDANKLLGRIEWSDWMPPRFIAYSWAGWSASDLKAISTYLESIEHAREENP